VPKLVGELLEEIIREEVPGLKEKYTQRRLTDDTRISEARRLATGKFVALGKIPEEEVGEDGILKHDVILPISTFFGTYDRDDHLLATGRLLWTPDTVVDDLRLPLDTIDPDLAEYLRDQPPGSIAEIGSLAKDDDVSTVAILKLLRGMWTFAGENGIKTFICGLDPKIYPSFRTSFGDALTELSEGTTEFPGIVGQQKPLMIDVRKAVADQDSSEHRSIPERMSRYVVGHFIVKDTPDVITHY
jgi:hypothetical protein